MQIESLENQHACYKFGKKGKRRFMLGGGGEWAITKTEQKKKKIFL